MNTALDLSGILSITENIEDFKIELASLKINNEYKFDLIADNKKSFTFAGTGNDILEYMVANYSYQYDAEVALNCTPNENVTVEQVSSLPAQSKEKKAITSTSTNEVTCEIDVEKVSRTDFAVDMCETLKGREWDFAYTGGVQEFTALCSGNYKLEVAGSAGGEDSGYLGGKGGYSSGEIILDENRPLYVVVGGNLYNGGGSSKGGYGANGGGATHIALSNYGELKNYESHKEDILIVAGGGGGGYKGNIYRGAGGDGGGETGGSGYRAVASAATGGSQTSGGNSNGSFGQGGTLSPYCSGGGGGYYGGGAGNAASGAGGSGYIGGVSNGSMTSGTNSGNGYAKITYLGK